MFDRRSPAIYAAACVVAAAAGSLLWMGPGAAPPVQVAAIAASADGRLLVAGTRDGDTAVWRLDPLRHIARITIRGGGLNILAFSPDGQWLAAAGRALTLWSTADWREARQFGATDRVYGTARFSGDGLLLASVNASERIEIWAVATGRRVQSICCMALYGDVALSRRGELLAAGGHWPSLWDTGQPRRIRRLVESRNPTFGAVALSEDGRVLATGSQDGIARLWDIESGRVLSSTAPRSSYIETVVFQPHGTLLAYGVRDGEVWLWDPAQRTERRIVRSAQGNVCFSGDGRWLIYGVPGGLVQLWDVAAGRNGPVLRLADEFAGR